MADARLLPGTRSPYEGEEERRVLDELYIFNPGGKPMSRAD